MRNDVVYRRDVHDAMVNAGYGQNYVIHVEIECIPAVDPESLRPHGEWEGYTTSAYMGVDEYGDVKWADRKFYRCSECRKGTAVQSKYCPNCGAKMDLEG